MISTHKIGAISNQVNQHNNYENYRYVIDSASPVLVETTIFYVIKGSEQNFIIEGYKLLNF